MYMPLMVRIQRVVLFADNTLPSGLERGVVRQKLRALQPFLDSAEDLEIVRKQQLQSGAEQAGQPRWQDFLLAAESRSKADLVVSCICVDELNLSLQEFCQEYGILCNVVDQKEFCNTWFMGVLETPNLLLGISSKGSCPYYAAHLRRDLQAYIQQKQPQAALLAECRRQLHRQNWKGLVWTGKLLHRLMYTLHYSQAFEQALQNMQLLQDSEELQVSSGAEKSGVIDTNRVNEKLEEQANFLLQQFFESTDFLQRELERE